MNINPLDIARNVFEIESKQISNLKNLLTNDFIKIINLIAKSSGKLIISGMGKSGIIGKKIAATLASTGTPSFFIHPGEAYHGDLGMIELSDIVLLISNSGETDEILKLIPFLSSQKNKTIAMTGNPNSTLAKNTQYHLNIRVEEEACPLKLAPTSSITASLVMGDAIAVALMKAKNFKEANFAKFHPGGSLGKRLLTTVSDVMISDSLPLIKPKASLMEVLDKITTGKCGIAIVLNEKSNLPVGVISDGDLRRQMKKNENTFFKFCAEEIMTSNPKTINYGAKLIEASNIMSKCKINSLIVINDSKECVGIVQLFDTGFS